VRNDELEWCPYCRVWTYEISTHYCSAKKVAVLERIAIALELIAERLVEKEE
jgi:hypothetical protein